MAEVSSLPALTPGALGPTASEFLDIRRQGFVHLQFPVEIEAAYQQETETDRIRRLKLGSIALLGIVIFLLLIDWLMVPDQLTQALAIRLLVYLPLSVMAIRAFRHLESTLCEWIALVMLVGPAAITSLLCTRSTDELAVPYLSGLALLLLFNGTLVRMRFRKAVLANLMILSFYVISVFSAEGDHSIITIPLTLVMISTTAFTLYGCYWLEHEDRANWLMEQHEQCLLEASAQANLRLDRMSRYDVLTDVANRRHLDEFLQQTWQRAQGNDQDVSLLMIDVDHFKAYNDLYGHPAGDACLKAVAAALKGSMRKPDDLLARYGGEEFVAVLNQSNLAVAQTAAERIREAVSVLQRHHAGSPTHQRVTVSIGVACMRPGGSQSSPDRLLAAADAALYKAKSMGRNRVSCA